MSFALISSLSSLVVAISVFFFAGDVGSSDFCSFILAAVSYWLSANGYAALVDRWSCSISSSQSSISHKVAYLCCSANAADQFLFLLGIWLFGGYSLCRVLCSCSNSNWFVLHLLKANDNSRNKYCRAGGWLALIYHITFPIDYGLEQS
jgi:hypothetical protein